MNNHLIEHALREFKAAGYDTIETSEEGPDKWIQENVLELLKVFSAQGHSGMSAPYCINTFSKLAKFESLAPLTGEDEEWVKLDGENGLHQNIRSSRVFKDKDGQAYDIYGRIFRGPNGGCYTSRDSRVYITFPYVPTTEYVDVPGD